jgi:archaeosortase B (VPXXXP-CTERM-specific)
MKSKEKHKEKTKKEKQEAQKKIIRFYIFFGLLFVLVFLIFPFLSPYSDPALSRFSNWTAGVLGLVLNILGLNPNISGPILVLEKLSIEVVVDCTGFYEMFIFMAAVLTYPAKFRKKLWGIALGLPLLYLINIMRMILITVLGNWLPQTFSFMHLYFWQVAGILIIGGMWFFWIEKVVKYEREAQRIPA